MNGGDLPPSPAGKAGASPSRDFTRRQFRISSTGDGTPVSPTTSNSEQQYTKQFNSEQLESIDALRSTSSASLDIGASRRESLLALATGTTNHTTRVLRPSTTARTRSSSTISSQPPTRSSARLEERRSRHARAGMDSTRVPLTFQPSASPVSPRIIPEKHAGGTTQIHARGTAAMGDFGSPGTGNLNPIRFESISGSEARPGLGRQSKIPLCLRPSPSELSPAQANMPFRDTQETQHDGTARRLHVQFGSTGRFPLHRNSPGTPTVFDSGHSGVRRISICRSPFRANIEPLRLHQVDAHLRESPPGPGRLLTARQQRYSLGSRLHSPRPPSPATDGADNSATTNSPTPSGTTARLGRPQTPLQDTDATRFKGPSVHGRLCNLLSHPGGSPRGAGVRLVCSGPAGVAAQSEQGGVGTVPSGGAPGTRHQHKRGNLLRGLPPPTTTARPGQPQPRARCPPTLPRRSLRASF